MKLQECDYVLAAAYREYDQHTTRASSVLQELVQTQGQWQTVRCFSTIFSYCHHIVEERKYLACVHTSLPSTVYQYLTVMGADLSCMHGAISGPFFLPLMSQDHQVLLASDPALQMVGLLGPTRPAFERCNNGRSHPR